MFEKADNLNEYVLYEINGVTKSIHALEQKYIKNISLEDVSTESLIDLRNALENLLRAEKNIVIDNMIKSKGDYLK